MPKITAKYFSNILLGLFVLVTTVINLLNSELRTAKQHLQTSLQKLQVSEARFRRLVESNIIGLIVANVELHGGTVSAESPGIGQGATFVVNLPMKAI
ncbi:ATP-binding protein [Nostoc sp.]|uniref:ATP-binding protein n=1 Tax=Nostoc sp. TaxID=1180 RepID=UPI002FFB0222